MCFAQKLLSCSTTFAVASWFAVQIFDSCIESFSFSSVSVSPVSITMAQGMTNREMFFLKQDERVPNSTENAKHDDGSKAWKKAKLPRMVKKGKL